MPKTSEKRYLINFVAMTLINDLVNLTLFGKGGQNDRKKIYEILEDATIFLATLDSCRYAAPFKHHIVPKSDKFLKFVLPCLDEGRFKQFSRCSRGQFHKICNFIENDKVFNGARAGKQFPVKVQLFITLYRFGSCGEGATISKTAALFGVGDGGTIQIITDRVISVILKLKNQYIQWPDVAERKRITEETFDELPFCIGYVDGTEIKLAEKPFQDPEAYFSRKGLYSLKMQVICDNKLRIRHAVIGYPGSVHDARIYNNCEIATSPEKFFCDNQWIAGDSAYRLTNHVITPFRTNSVVGNLEQRRNFNKAISQYRIRIEHCFGLLKERFSSLKELRIQIKNDDSIKKACRWIIACVIVHNILIEDNGGKDFEMETNLSHQMEDYNYSEDLFATTDVSAENKRKAIINLLQL